MGKIAASFFVLCLTALPAFAAVDRSIIPAEAQWLVHLDVQGLLNSRLFSEAQERETDLDFDNNRDYQEMKARLGIDITKDVDSVTIYGLPRHPEAVVFMAHSHRDLDEVMVRLSVLAPRTDVEVDGLQLSRWAPPEGNKTVYSYLARHADSDERILLVAQDANDLVIGIEALRGESATLDDGDSELGVSATDGAILQVSADGQLADWADVEPASNIAKLVRSAVVEFGENSSAVYAHVTVETASAADAARVTQILQGAMALASLASEMEKQLKDLLPLLQGLKFHADGSTLTIHFEHDLDDLIAMLENTVQRTTIEEFTTKPKSKPKRNKPATGSKWY